MYVKRRYEHIILLDTESLDPLYSWESSCFTILRIGPF